MRRRSVALVLSVLMGFATAPVAQATGGNVLWVAASGSVGAGTSCASPNYVGSTHVALQAAITAAIAGDEIRVCSGTYNIGTTLTIGKSLTISGQSYPLPILDGGGSVRVIDVDTGGIEVSLSRLHIQHGYVAYSGGAGVRVHNDARLVVRNAHFAYNRASGGHGGAISMEGDVGDTGSLDIQRSSFFSNRAFDGGAINYSGVRGATPEPTSVVADSSFVENIATRNGGALNGSFSYLTATNSTFLDNNAESDGHTSWAASIRTSLIAFTTPVPTGDVACKFGVSDARDGNVSTDSSCLHSGGSAVALSSLHISFFAPWGGDTPTVKIGSSSVARNAVGSALCTSTDQRGTSRSGTYCDAGAFEYVEGLPDLSTTSEVTLAKGRAVDTTFVFAATGLVAPIEYRVASEASDVPPGVSMSSAGRLTGTPSRSSVGNSLVVTATDANGAIASAQVAVENCLLSTQSGRYIIASANDLDLFRVFACGMDADYTQTANITWDDTWEDLSTSDDPFSGSYDGGGFSIGGLHMEGDQTAFVVRTDGASITDLSLEVEVSGAYGSAGLVRYAIATTIEDVHVSGSITTPVEAGDRGCLGGLAGETESSTIRRSSFEGTVIDSHGSYLGGLVGCPYAETVIESSYFSGTVEGIGSLGGLVGWMDGTDIRDSYAVGTVRGSGADIGGLVGYQSGDTSDADSIALSNSYASTAVSGSSSFGALIGIGVDNAISGSVWQAELSGPTELNPFGAFQSGTGSQPAIAALTAGEMKAFSTFEDAGWRIVNGWESAATSANTWGICSASTRPYLLWEHASSPCTPTGSTSSTTSESATTSAPKTTPQTSTTQSPVTTIAGQPVGGAEITVNGQRLSASLTWASDNTIRGTIGGVNIALRFEEGLTSPDLRPVIVRGRSFRLSLRGLQPESVLSATIFSRPTRLGTFTVNGDGTIRKVVNVPSKRSLGLHRLRVIMVDQEGRAITLWLGVHIRGAKALNSARAS